MQEMSPLPVILKQKCAQFRNLASKMLVKYPKLVQRLIEWLLVSGCVNGSKTQAQVSGSA